MQTNSKGSVFTEEVRHLGRVFLNKECMDLFFSV